MIINDILLENFSVEHNNMSKMCYLIKKNSVSNIYLFSLMLLYYFSVC